MRAAATVIQSYYILTVNLLRVQHILGVEQKLEHLTIKLPYVNNIFNFQLANCEKNNMQFSLQ